MRKKPKNNNIAEITVTAPTRGVIDRIPSSQPDIETRRALTVGKNVRAHDGVLESAPGFDFLAMSPNPDGEVLLIEDGSLTTDGGKTITQIPVVATTRKIYSINIEGTGFPPLVYAGIDEELPETNVFVAFLATASDPAGLTLTYVWSVVQQPIGSKVRFYNDILQPDFVVDTPGIYEFKLTATNSQGLSNSDNVIVNFSSALDITFAPHIPVVNDFDQPACDGTVEITTDETMYASATIGQLVRYLGNAYEVTDLLPDNVLEVIRRCDEDTALAAPEGATIGGTPEDPDGVSPGGSGYDGAPTGGPEGGGSGGGARPPTDFPSIGGKGTIFSYSRVIPGSGRQTYDRWVAKFVNLVGTQFLTGFALTGVLNKALADQAMEALTRPLLWDTYQAASYQLTDKFDNFLGLIDVSPSVIRYGNPGATITINGNNFTAGIGNNVYSGSYITIHGITFNAIYATPNMSLTFGAPPETVGKIKGPNENFEGNVSIVGSKGLSSPSTINEGSGMSFKKTISMSSGGNALYAEFGPLVYKASFNINIDADYNAAKTVNYLSNALTLLATHNSTPSTIPNGAARFATANLIDPKLDTALPGENNGVVSVYVQGEPADPESPGSTDEMSLTVDIPVVGLEGWLGNVTGVINFS